MHPLPRFVLRDLLIGSGFARARAEINNAAVDTSRGSGYEVILLLQKIP